MKHRSSTAQDPIQCQRCGIVWYTRTLHTESDIQRHAKQSHGVAPEAAMSIMGPPPSVTARRRIRRIRR